MKVMWENIVRQLKQRFDRLKNYPGDLTMLLDTAKPLLLAAAITVFSFLAVDIFYKIISLRIVGSPAPSTRQSFAVAALPVEGYPAERYGVITERNLFSTTLTAIVDKDTGSLLPSEEYTAFDLKGTIAVDEFTGYAIVEEKGKDKQKLYRIGEMIGSARLIRVTRNTAVLKGGEKEYIMRIKETGEGAVSRLAGDSSRTGRPGRGIVLSKKEVEANMGDLESLMSQAVIRPYFVEGAQQGFIVSNIVPGSVYQKLGLQNGDVVVDVNNEKLDSPDDILQLMNVMQAGGSVSVNLMRNGKKETVNYSFN